MKNSASSHKNMIGFACMALAGTATMGSANSVEASDAHDRSDLPNILWITTEDIGPLLSVYGTPGIHTPNIDRLAEDGIRYNHAYTTSGVCAPSRSSIITAMHQVSIGTHNMRTGSHYLYRSAEEETYETYQGVYDVTGRNVPEYSAVIPPYVRPFTEYLREVGYYTTNADKMDYQFSGPVTAWDESSPEAHYSNAPEGRPFFSIINHHVTHESRMWMKKDDPLLTHPDTVPIPDYFPDISVVREAQARNFSNIMELDEQVGEIIDQLKEEGIYDETVIFFWSDHGGPLLREKRAVGNTGLHVPLIVKLPHGEKAGTEVDDLVSLMDLGPTVMSLAGIPAPDHLHGRAFLGPYVTETPHPYIFGAADRFDTANDMSRSVLDGRFVYIRNFRPELPLIYRIAYREQIEMTRVLIEMNRLGKLEGDAAYIFMPTKPLEELYDLKYDPYEVNNVAEKPEYAEKLEELRGALADWQLEAGDMGFIPERDLVKMMWPGLIQPETKPVQFSHSGDKVTLRSPTEGARIAYQLGDRIDGDHWELYHKPVSLSAGETIQAKAVRIGYRPAERVRFSAP
ncbi:sulfatase-like hydrolase/transferase [Balneolales bacterium ANBcel1]|nr:sulfatase-like hydrolase/transferase [Balneolales bacterium ANBcel1]